MRPVALLDWAAWSPGVESREAWRAWAARPRAVDGAGAPEVKFVPSLLRRRCDALSRMMLHVAHEVCPAEALATVPTVFASRHGSFETRVGMLFNLARREPISPTRFSHSVHNAQSGLFSIWTGNRAPSTSVAAGEDTFAHGLLEAVAQLARSHPRPVLYVTGDAAFPAEIGWLGEQKPGSYALALLLGDVRGDAPDDRATGGETPPERLEIALEPGAGEPPSEQPDALRFLAWLLSGRDALRIDHGRIGWVVRRASATRPSSV